MSVSAQIDFEGPFFQVDPGETLLKNIQKMMQGVAEEGAAAARANLMSGAGSRALVAMTGDRVGDHVIGRTTSLVGKQWVAAAVVQVSNQGMDGATSRSLMAAGGGRHNPRPGGGRGGHGIARGVEERGHPIRKVATQLRRARSVLTANLTAGME